MRLTGARRARSALFVAALLVAVTLALAPCDDDERMDPRRADARRAIAVALEVVPGAVVGVARDRDDGNWEITVRQDATDYEVELQSADLALLGIDYD